MRLSILVFALLMGCAQKPDLPEPEKKDPAPAPLPDPVAPPLPEPEKPKPPRSTAARPQMTYQFVAMEALTDNAELAAALQKLSESGAGKNLRKRFEALKSAGATDALLGAMRAPIPNVRAQAAVLLNRMDHKSKGFSKLLNETVLGDPDEDVRGMAGRVLVYYQRHKLKSNTEALAEALEKDKTEAVRMHAAWALGASHDRRGTSALIGALDDESTDVRLRVVGALKRIKAKKAVPHIVGRLEDSNALVRERALEVLRKLTGKSHGPGMAAWRKAYPLPK